MPRLVQLDARYRSRCEGCGDWIYEGDPIWWDTEDRVAYCEPCGLTEATERALDEDER